MSPKLGTCTTETDTITVSPNSFGLLAGTYTGTITVMGAGETHQIQVTYTVLNPTPDLSTSPSSLSFSSVIFGGDPDPKTISVWNSGEEGSTLAWSAINNKLWLVMSPKLGTCTTETDTITVSPNSFGLLVGTYTGTITVMGAGETHQIPVTYTVTR